MVKYKTMKVYTLTCDYCGVTFISCVDTEEFTRRYSLIGNAICEGWKKAKIKNKVHYFCCGECRDEFLTKKGGNDA